MAELKYLEPTELLEKIYATLCSEYEDAQHYKDKKDQEEIAITKRRLTKKVFNEFVVDEEYFLTMNDQTFNERYHLYEEDFLRLIKDCSENGVKYDSFLQIIDDLIASAKFRIHAFEQLTEEIQRLKEGTDEEEEGEEEEE
ncbi:hypothetical protein QE429_000931 [Bacillus sp. SORGH_AS 510]|uniref:hypothetical protein n=1 Tax=Bacillus sp. SORGH_AS_0510 TaxID=3041771 RepID=UPI00278A5F8F|nr:hypothetical protein [Bacillus sp. SORGH_AS_0510]MDQ1144104.1 hypothetical protein [Bacillus sp. SORGH_AS_0510]